MPFGNVERNYDDTPLRARIAALEAEVAALKAKSRFASAAGVGYTQLGDDEWLVADSLGIVSVGFWDENDNYWRTDGLSGEVAFYMPLPEFPKEQE